MYYTKTKTQYFYQHLKSSLPVFTDWILNNCNCSTTVLSVKTLLTLHKKNIWHVLLYLDFKTFFFAQHMSMEFIHIVLSTSGLLLVLLVYSTHLWKLIQFIYSITEGYLECCQLSGIIKNSTVYMYLFFFCFGQIGSLYMGQAGLELTVYP